MSTAIHTGVNDQAWCRTNAISITAGNLKAMANLLKEVYGSSVWLNGKYNKTVGYIYGRTLAGELAPENLALYVFIESLSIVDFKAKKKLTMYDLFEHRPGHGSAIFWKLDDKHLTPLDVIKGRIRDLDDTDDSRNWTVENR